MSLHGTAHERTRFDSVGNESMAMSLETKQDVSMQTSELKSEASISTLGVVSMYHRATDSSLSNEKHVEAPTAATTLPAFRPGFRFHLAWASLCVVTLMAALDATSLSVALARISGALHGSTIEAFWAGTSFLLTSTVFQPVIGSLSSIFGRKSMLILSLLLFAAGAIVAALAQPGDGMAMLLVGRGVQGVGGGGVIVLAEILATDLVPLRQRGNYMAAINAMWAFGSVGGPLIGAFVSKFFRAHNTLYTDKSLRQAASLPRLEIGAGFSGSTSLSSWLESP